MITFRQREQRIAKQEQEWDREKNILQREVDLKKDKKSFKLNQQKKKSTTNKKLIWFLFLNCSIIEIFVGYVTLKSFDLAVYTSCNPDFTPLVTLVGAVVSEVIGYAIYALKAMKENTAGGITYDMAMMDPASIIDAPVVEPEPPMDPSEKAIGIGENAQC